VGWWLFGRGVWGWAPGKRFVRESVWARELNEVGVVFGLGGRGRWGGRVVRVVLLGVVKFGVVG